MEKEALTGHFGGLIYCITDRLDVLVVQYNRLLLFITSNEIIKISISLILPSRKFYQNLRNRLYNF